MEKGKMNITPNFITQSLTSADVDIIFELLSKNKLFYEYHPPFVTRESILEDMNALPPGKSFKDKLYCIPNNINYYGTATPNNWLGDTMSLLCTLS